MDLEMVLNELSLRTPAKNIQTAREWMSDLISTARTASEVGIKPILRTHSEFYATLLASEYSLSNWLVDKDVDREQQRFILLSTKAPFLADIEDSNLNDKSLRSEFCCEGETSEGIGIAFLLESLALSVRSDSRWESSSLILEVTWLEDDNNLYSERVTVFHASRLEHLQEHVAWIQDRLRTSVRDGFDLWNRKGEFFPSLEFCDNACKQIQKLGNGDPMLRQVVRRLFELEKGCQIWKSGNFDLETLACKASPESESRLKRLKQQLTFKCPDGKERIFSLHVRMTPGAWRLHFSVELGPGKIIIGYIGCKII
jgi:hypothetical protein